MARHVGVLLASLTLTACGGDDAPNPRFIDEVRANVPGAQAYTDEQLSGMADNICTLGNTADGVRILDNYSGIEAEDYEEFAQIALSTACD